MSFAEWKSTFSKKKKAIDFSINLTNMMTAMVIFATNQEMRFYWVGQIRMYKETGRADSITG